MNLLVSDDDYCVQKIVLVASLAGIELTVKKGLTPKAVSEIDGRAKSMVLTTASGGTIGQHTAILKFLGDFNSAVPLVGVTEMDRALVSQWIGFCWQELGK